MSYQSRCVLITLTLVLATGASVQPQSQAREDGWRTDLDILQREVQRQHYVYRAQPLPNAFVEGLAQLKARLGRMEDERVLAEAGRLMVLLGDGHSYLLPAGAARVPGRWLPLHLYQFRDGLFVIDAPEPYRELIGGRVERLGAIGAEQAMARAAAFVPKDNEVGIRWMAPLALRFRGILEAIGATPAEGLPLVIKKGGQTRRWDIPFAAVMGFSGVPKLVPSRVTEATPAPDYLRFVDRPYWLRSYPGGVVYVQFNQVRDAPDETLAAFSQRLAILIRDSQAQAVVVDVRHNNGGDETLLRPLVDTLTALDRETPGARLVVLMGRNTFSAAQVFIARLDAATRVVFAGEPSSSRPNFVGEENPVILPWSGAIASISNRYHEQIPGDSRPWIPPDWPLALGSTDYFANRDPLLQLVLQRVTRVPSPR
jgi:hypothetical protein